MHSTDQYLSHMNMVRCRISRYSVIAFGRLIAMSALPPPAKYCLLSQVVLFSGSLEQVPLIRYKSLSEACSTGTKYDSSLGTALNSLYIFMWNLPSLARCTDAGTKFRLRVVRLTENPAVRQGLRMVGAAIRKSFRWIQA